jgi:pimeloyl-ACP methyl ester carboxylesterase
LRDGRRLGFEECGCRRGRPVLLFHGLPGSRLQRPAHAASYFSARGVRLITVDRPGIGLSDPRPGRRMLDWPDDVRQLADALGIRQFRVVGISGGGPYALACAYALADRVPAAATVGGLAPFDVEGLAEEFERFALWFFGGLRRTPRAIRLTLGALAFVLRRTPFPAQSMLLERRCARDLEALKDPLLRKLLCRDFREATRQGISGILDDATVLSQPWGFEPRCIEARVDIWHGTADTIVRPVMGEYLARTLPRARRRFVADEGHFSVPLSQLSAMVEALLEPVRRPRPLALAC